MEYTIRERRIRLGLTQQELAELAGCSIAMVRLLDKDYAPENSPTRDRVEAELVKQEEHA